MKKVLIGLLVIVLLVAGAVLWLLGNLDKMVKNQIEVIGTELAGVPVRVGGVAIDLKSGMGQISNLRIGNPEKYQAADAFDMNLLRIDIDVGSLLKQPLVLDELVIDSPVANMEIDESGGSNLKDILDNVSKNSAKADEKAAAGPAGKDGDAGADKKAGEPVRISIRRLLINGVTFNLETPLEEAPRSGTLPAIEKRDIGGSKGATPGEIGKIIVGDLSREIIQKAAEKKMKEAISEKADGLLKRIGEAVGRPAEEGASPPP